MTTKWISDILISDKTGIYKRDVSFVAQYILVTSFVDELTRVVPRTFMAGMASQAGDVDSSRVSPLVCRGPWMSTVVLYCLYHSDSASVHLYFTFLSHWFPLPCGACSTVPREGFDFKCYYAFFLVCCGRDTSYIVSVHIQCQASLYTLLLCRGIHCGCG